MNKALKKLRIKFVATIMVVVTLILAVVFTTIVVINYNNGVNEVYQALESSLSLYTANQQPQPGGQTAPNTNSESANTGNENPSTNTERSSAGEENLSTSTETPNDSSKDPNTGSENSQTSPGGPRFEIGNRTPNQSFIPVAVYELDVSGQLSLVSNLASGSIADSALDEASTVAQTLADGHGYLDSLGVFYLKESKGPNTFIAFADERSVSEWQPLALGLLGIGLLALVVFFVLSLFFSKWALRPLAESLNKQQQFVADASHELKTPLTVIAANTAILKRHPEASIASQSQWIESIEAETSQMQELVGDMLLLARADIEETSENPAENASKDCLDFSKLVEANLLQFEPLAYERNINFSDNIQEKVLVVGTKDKLQRLISVLLDNAFKYVDSKGSIHVALTAEHTQAKLTVSNSGTAIPAEDLPHIFDRFYRSDKSRARDSQQSYGLGLSIAYEIARSHKGSIEVSSAENTGTTFTVILPTAG